MLPSEALANATTFDLYVLDTYSRYVKYQQQKAEGNPVLGGKARSLTVTDMQKMIERVRTPDIVEKEAKERMKK